MPVIAVTAHRKLLVINTSIRRSIMVEPKLEHVMESLPYLESLGQAAANLLNEYSNEQLGMICEFLDHSADLLHNEAAKLSRLPKQKK